MSEEPVLELPMLATEHVGDVLIIRFQVNRIMEKSVIDAIGKELAVVFDPPAAHKVIVDLQDVEYLCSDILGQFVHLLRDARIMKAKLRLCGLTLETQKVFCITGLNKLIHIDPDRAASLAAINEK